MLFARYILPWYGGVPAVWTICMLCFQVILVAGYAYSHLIVRKLSARGQRWTHVCVVLAALTLVGALALAWGTPLLPGDRWKPDADDWPAVHIVSLVAVALGVPFFVTATTSSLVQAWFAYAFPGAATYRLYALSNLGSLLGLASYPAVVERLLPLRAQAWWWAIGFALLGVSIAGCALVVRRAGRERPEPVNDPLTAVSPPRVVDCVLWLALAACPSALLLATTNYMSQEIAVFPLLWMLPLALYLLSFVLVFESDRWYARGVWAGLLVLAVALSTLALDRGVWAHVLLQTGLPAAALFIACMVCHGELARLKPAPEHLTAFYLAVTVGGAVGGACVAVAAPAVFLGTWEYPLTLWAAAALAFVTFAFDASSPVRARPIETAAATLAAGVGVAIYTYREWLFPSGVEISDWWLFGAPAAGAALGFGIHFGLGRRVMSSAGGGTTVVALAAAALGLAATAAALYEISIAPTRYAVEQARSFYGIVHVVDELDHDALIPAYKLRHGRIAHGQQFRDDKRQEPTTYYGPDSGIGLAIQNHPHRAAGLRLGVVGLGVGTLAAYGLPGDRFRFYELNPDVVRLSGLNGSTFSYLRDSAASIEIVPGDARLALEAELARGLSHKFHVLALDAFSSDAVPIHLLTREAIEVYLKHLDPGGILAIHISNRYVELRPVIRGLADHFGLARKIVSSEKHGHWWACTWALLARDGSRLEIKPIADAADDLDTEKRSVLWTDDYSNLIRLLKL
jgi:hypothetical protein